MVLAIPRSHLRAIGETEFREYVLHVILRGAFRHEEVTRDLLVRATGSHEGRDFELTRRQWSVGESHPLQEIVDAAEEIAHAESHCLRPCPLQDAPSTICIPALRARNESGSTLDVGVHCERGRSAAPGDVAGRGQILN